jgi:hypothetical protein
MLAWAHALQVLVVVVVVKVVVAVLIRLLSKTTLCSQCSLAMF